MRNGELTPRITWRLRAKDHPDAAHALWHSGAQCCCLVGSGPYCRAGTAGSGSGQDPPVWDGGTGSARSCPARDLQSLGPMR